jgi:hypothetical protein
VKVGCHSEVDGYWAERSLATRWVLTTRDKKCAGMDSAEAQSTSAVAARYLRNTHVALSQRDSHI